MNLSQKIINRKSFGKRIFEGFRRTFAGRILKRLFEDRMTLDKALNILGLKSVPPESELKSLHKKLALQNHPDRGGSVEKMAEINAAYDFLKDSPVGAKSTGSSRASSSRSSYSGNSNWYSNQRNNKNDFTNEELSFLKNVQSKVKTRDKKIDNIVKYFVDVLTGVYIKNTGENVRFTYKQTIHNASNEFLNSEISYNNKYFRDVVRFKTAWTNYEYSVTNNDNINLLFVFHETFDTKTFKDLSSKVRVELGGKINDNDISYDFCTNLDSDWFDENIDKIFLNDDYLVDLFSTSNIDPKFEAWFVKKFKTEIKRTSRGVCWTVLKVKRKFGIQLTRNDHKLELNHYPENIWVPLVIQYSGQDRKYSYRSVVPNIVLREEPEDFLKLARIVKEAGNELYSIKEKIEELWN